MKRFLWLGFVLFLYVICSGCGDTFRPIIIPNPPTFPNPKAAHTVVSINDNGTVVIGSTSTISLPIYSGANFVAVAPTDTTAYVTLPTYPPDPTQPLNIVPSVGVVSTQSNNLVATIPVGNNPVALAVTPDKSKLYVANKGSNSVSGFNTAD